MLTKQQFLIEYKRALPLNFPWAENTEKLDSFMRGVARTIGGNPAHCGSHDPNDDTNNVWNFDSPLARSIYRAHVKESAALKNRYSLKALRALPME